MNITDKQLSIFLNRYEFSFSKKRIKICEPRYIDIDEGVVTIIRNYHSLSLFAYRGLIFVVYLKDKNEEARQHDKDITTDFIWEICVVLHDRSCKKVREARRVKFIENHIVKHVNGEANAMF